MNAIPLLVAALVSAVFIFFVSRKTDFGDEKFTDSRFNSFDTPDYSHHGHSSLASPDHHHHAVHDHAFESAHNGHDHSDGDWGGSDSTSTD